MSDELTKVLTKEEAKANTRSTQQCLWYKDLKGLDVDLLSYIGLTTSMDGVGLKHDFTKVLVKIGKRIEMEHWSEGLREYNSKLAKRLEDKVTKDHSSERYREKAVKNIASKEGYKVDTWKEERRVQVAAPVFNAVVLAAPSISPSELLATYVPSPSPVPTIYPKSELALTVIVGCNTQKMYIFFNIVFAGCAQVTFDVSF